MSKLSGIILLINAMVANLILYVSLFVSVFFEVFLLITYFEIREEIKFERAHAGKDNTDFPSVSIIVPSFNEGETVRATIDSLLALDYPQHLLNLILVDDGSSDNTLEILNSYKGNPQVQIFSKKNGGKHTALNLALEHVTTDLVGCLDADSFVDREALKRIVPYFGDAAVMAVTPAVRIHEPKSILQHVQKIEYSWGVLLRRILASIDGLYVTPGPFSIFRVNVFKELGGYRFAYHTEDMELALRMQRHRYKIVNSSTAHVYTVGPAKLKGLYKQRVRWSYGFLNNMIDYKDMYFNPKFGSVGIFVLPIATFSIFSTLFAASQFVLSFLRRIPNAITKYQAVGFSTPHLPHPSFDWFFINTGFVSLLTVAAIGMSLVLLALSLQMTEGKVRVTRGLLYYLALYVFIVPFWLAKAVYATIRRQSISWR